MTVHALVTDAVDVIVGGVRTRFLLEGPFVRSFDEWCGRGLPADPDQEAAVTLEITTRPPPPPPGVAPILAAEPMQIRRDGDLVDLRTPSGAAGQLDLATGRAVVHGAGDVAAWTAALHVTKPLWHIALGRHGLHDLHASAVRHRNRAVLMAGASGAGKSTLAWQLAREGCALIGDDVAFVTDEPVRVTGLGDLPRLHADSEVARPQGAVQPDGKARIDVALIEDSPQAPALFLIMERVEAPATTATPMQPRDLLPWLLKLGMLTIDPVRDRPRLLALAELARTTPALHIRRGQIGPTREELHAWLQHGHYD